MLFSEQTKLFSALELFYFAISLVWTIPFPNMHTAGPFSGFRVFAQVSLKPVLTSTFKRVPSSLLSVPRSALLSSRHLRLSAISSYRLHRGDVSPVSLISRHLQWCLQVPQRLLKGCMKTDLAPKHTRPALQHYTLAAT